MVDLAPDSSERTKCFDWLNKLCSQVSYPDEHNIIRDVIHLILRLERRVHGSCTVLGFACADVQTAIGMLEEEVLNLLSIYLVLSVVHQSLLVSQGSLSLHLYAYSHKFSSR